MRRRLIDWTLAWVAALAACASGATDAPAAAPTAAAAPVAPLSAPKLDQLTAVIALYPDPLLAQLLAAATHPRQLAAAAHWLDDPANAALDGDRLYAAMQQQSWDPSVKSLLPFPPVLRQMSRNLPWTERIGHAFLVQQADVMDCVQRLRRRAVAAGALSSTPQQSVSDDGHDITIEPANPAIVYVPHYDPAVVYGPWAMAAFPPYFFGFPPDTNFHGGLVGFGDGMHVVPPLWGGYQWDWRGRGLNIAPPASPLPAHPWRRDVAGHRSATPGA